MSENGREVVERKIYATYITSVFVVSLLLAVQGCNAAKRASRSYGCLAAALMLAAEGGHDETVRMLNHAGGWEVNGPL